MELIQSLPEIFEQYSEQRRNSFLAAYEFKKRGIPLLGVFCTYFPQELAEAMGLAVVSLCSTSEETIPDAEEDLPRNLCPLVKSSYGFAKTGKCPYFHFSDLIVGETTCDGKKKMYELLARHKPVYVMELPNTQSEDALVLWKREIIKLKERLETQFDRVVTEEALRQAVHRKNEERRALKAFYEVMKLEPVPILGEQVFHVLTGTQYRFDTEQATEDIKALTKKIYEDYARCHPYDSAPRILVTGCPLGGVAEKTVGAIEACGAHVVVYENCGGAKAVDQLVDEEAEDIHEAIARRYLNIGCSVMTPDANRLSLLARLIEEFRVDGVVEVTLQACHTYNIEAMTIRQFVREQMHLPYLCIETDYSTSDTGQLNTRIAAFVEML